MTEHYGVKCEKCGEHNSLEEIQEASRDQAIFYTVPLDPITCGKCGHSGLYGPKDGVYFRKEDPTPNGHP